MNARILELLENPKMIQAEDLSLLQKEINTYPYIQNIRALHLYGVHLYDKENYQKALSSTAAYTTDKKILYQFINGKSAIISSIESIKQDIKNTSSGSIKEETPVAIDITDNITAVATEVCEVQSEKSSKSNSIVTINGEVNRILFEGEEEWFEEAIIKSQQNIQEETVVEKVPEEVETLESDEIVSKQVIEEPKESEEETVVEEVQEEAEHLESDEIVSEQIIEEPKESEEETVVEEVQEEVETLENYEIVSEQIIEEPKESQEETLIEEVPEEVLENKTEIVSKEITNEEEVIKDLFSLEVPNSETLIDEGILGNNNIEEIINKETELSFHATDSFLPEVKIESQKPQDTIKITEVSPKLNKHEEEMKRLVEEVEMKLKAKKANTVLSEKKDIPQQIANSTEKIELPIKEEAIEISEDTNPSWKPMSFENSVPDALLSKVQPSNNIKSDTISSIEEKITEPKENEKEIEEKKDLISSIISPSTDPETHSEEISGPVINVSFFPKEISNFTISSEENKEKSPEIKEESSNVKGFISTWQSWLKIDRQEEKIVSPQQPKPSNEKIEEIKNKAIDSFIENNPRISQLKDKEEVNFVVKEKKKDISHLMTETLANLYVEQKLYAQAIKAFKALIIKHPDKKAHFEKRIKEVQESRNKN